MNVKDLLKPFPKDKISWRAQTVTKDGKKALALAYIDARDVMERLDDVCGPENWQSNHFDCGNGRLGCTISIKIGDQWISKSDGAGDTQVEAEKGAFSGAFKRAAVSWGIGRYLYDFNNIWCPCETYDSNGKKKFSKFTDSPWNYVGKNNMPEEKDDPITRDQVKAVSELFAKAKADADKFHTHFGTNGDIRNLKQSQYEVAVKMLNVKIGEKNEV